MPDQSTSRRRENRGASSDERTKAYTITLEPLAGNKVRVPVPFDANEVWEPSASTMWAGRSPACKFARAHLPGRYWLELLGRSLRSADSSRRGRRGRHLAGRTTTRRLWRQICGPHSSRIPWREPSSTRSPSSTEKATYGESTRRSDGPTSAPNASPRLSGFSTMGSRSARGRYMQCVIAAPAASSGQRRSRGEFVSSALS